MTRLPLKERPAIRYLIGSLSLGGAERHLLQISTGLAARNWQVTVMTLGDKNPLTLQFEQGGVRVVPVPRIACPQWIPKWIRAAFITPALIVSLSMRLKQSQCSTHFFLPHSYIIGMVAHQLARLRTPVFMSRRSLNYYQKKIPFSGWLERVLHKRLTAALGNSKAVVSQLLDEGIPGEHLHLIYNGLDLDTINREQGRKTAPIPAETYLYCVANFIPYKGHRDLIDALAWVMERNTSSWHILCFGRDDGILDELKQYAVDRHVGDRISWIVGETRPWEYMIPGNIGVLASHEEGFSNAILEMMGSGLAVVATDVGGNSESVTEECGFLVPARDPVKLGQALLRLITDPNIRRQVAENAQTRIKSTYSIGACLDAYEDVYRHYGVLK